MDNDREGLRGTLRAGLLLGIGLGGFIDGIVLHQLLQWHNMMSSRVPPTTMDAMKYNMVWDGLFHLLTWTLTLVGVALLWRALRRVPQGTSGRELAGAMVAGWGVFNVVEGLIDHQLLGIHHVRSGPHQLGWDVGLLIFGAALCAAGAWLVRRGRRRDRARGPGRLPQTAVPLARG